MNLYKHWIENMKRSGWMVLLTLTVTSVFGAEPIDQGLLKLEPLVMHQTDARGVVNLGGTNWFYATIKENRSEKPVGKAGDANVFLYTDPEYHEADLNWTEKPVPSLTQPLGRVHYYRRTFALTEAQANQRVVLTFEGISKQFRVEVNDQKVLRVKQSAYTERVDISDFVKPGENKLMVACYEYVGDRNAWTEWVLFGYQHRIGIYRPVYLEITDKVYIDDVGVKTQVEPQKVFSADVVLKNDTDQAVKTILHASIAHPGSLDFKSVSVKIPAQGCVTAQVEKAWADAKLWTPATPSLYWLDLALTTKNSLFSKEETGDQYRVRFGFRELKWENTQGRFLLNGKPFSVVRDSDGEPWQWDEGAIKDAMQNYLAHGLNGMRLFSPFDLRRWAKAADEVGFFIVTANASGWGASYKEDEFWPRWHRTLQHMVNEARNSPSIVVWGISNEFGTIYGGNRYPTREENLPFAIKQGEGGEYVASLDPTRPWEAFGEIELRWHGGKGPMPIRSYHYPYSPPAGFIPMVGRWFAEGKNGWQGAFDYKAKPTSISEDLFHGTQDNHRNITSWSGDACYTPAGYAKALHACVKAYAMGYYDADIAEWNPWCFYQTIPGNIVYELGLGNYHPFWMTALRETGHNLFAGEEAHRTIAVFNRWFTPLKGKVRVEWEVLGKREAREFPVYLDAGGKADLDWTFVVPKTKAPALMNVTSSLVDDAGKVLQTDAFSFAVAPRLRPQDIKVPAATAALLQQGSPLEALKFPNGIHRTADDAIGSGAKFIVSDKALTIYDGSKLDHFVKRGGKVLQTEPGQGDWCLLSIPKLSNHAYVWRRHDDVMVDVPEGGMRLWETNMMVCERSFTKPVSGFDTKLLWDAGKGGNTGLGFAAVVWIWRDAGGWLLNAVNVKDRFDVEPMASHFFQSLLNEFASEDSVPPMASLVLVDSPKFREDSESTNHVVNLRVFCERNKIGFSEMPLTDVLGRGVKGDSVFVFDAGATNLTQESRNIIRNLYTHGERVVLLNMAMERDEGFLEFLGIQWEDFPHVMAPIPWNHSQTNAVDTAAKWVVRRDNRGVMAGISNEDLFWWNYGDMWNWGRYEMSDTYPTFEWQRKKGESYKPMSGIFSSVSSDTLVLTEPGAVGIKKEGKGVLLFTTLDIFDKGFGSKHEEAVARLIRTWFNNLGATTALPERGMESYSFIDLKPYANVLSWANPKYKGEDGKFDPPVFFGYRDGGEDFRYFPVNQSGWSPVARNFCPVDEFPDESLNIGGIPFLLVNPDKNGGKVIFDGAVQSNSKSENKEAFIHHFEKPTLIKKLHFLGAGRLGYMGSDVFFDNRLAGKFTGKQCPNFMCVIGGPNQENVIAWTREYDAVDFHPEEGNAHPVFIYRWVIENPEPDKPVETIRIEDMSGLLMGLTVEN